MTLVVGLGLNHAVSKRGTVGTQYVELIETANKNWLVTVSSYYWD